MLDETSSVPREPAGTGTFTIAVITAPQDGLQPNVTAFEYVLGPVPGYMDALDSAIAKLEGLISSATVELDRVKFWREQNRAAFTEWDAMKARSTNGS